MKKSLLSIIKSSPVTAIIFFLLSFLSSTKLQAQITISPWKMNLGGGPQTVSPFLPFHGAPAAYNYVSVPAVNDALWVNAPLDGSGNVAFSVPSQLGAYPCLGAVDFTYFQTLVTIPSFTAINTFTVSFTQVDDGARAYIFNSAHPSGAFIDGGDIVLSGPAVTANLASLAVAGEVNRIVIAQFDDCAVENNVRGIQIIVNGTPIPVAASINCPDNITVNSTMGQCGAIVTFPAAVADGNPTPTINYSHASGSFFPLGTTTVTATATNATSTASCSFTVTVNGQAPSCNITSVPSNNTYTGGVPTNIYLGYGPQSTTLNVILSAGSVGSTYAWASVNGLDKLSSTSSSAPIFTPTQAGSYTFTVTTTNTNGCISTCSITICVLDIRVPGTDGKKVYICHLPPGNTGNPQTLEVSVNAVYAHIFNPGHGDHLGTCNQVPCSNPALFTRSPQGNAVNEILNGELSISARSNPTKGNFNLQLQSGRKDPVNLRIMDMSGRVVYIQKNINPNSTLNIGEKFLAGSYLVEVVQGIERKTIQLVKMK